ncbi:hypothetical protein, partial [Enterobacter cloacae complex sp. 4DZ1-17B1]|uniref:hypothetical protein n=1 Tax=Enterobacter cloacae complex sp. 4DZ1-17B1 TaxID=2511991 RepID=UPI001CA5C352
PSFRLSLMFLCVLLDFNKRPLELVFTVSFKSTSFANKKDQEASLQRGCLLKDAQKSNRCNPSMSLLFFISSFSILGLSEILLLSYGCFMFKS